MEERFSEKLLEEFGITGAVATNINTFGRSIIIMPGGEFFSPEGAYTIINLSKSEIPWKGISPDNISFKAPKPLKTVSHFIRQSDIMETVLNFFNLDYSSAVPVSVKFNK